jgi:hypothetical protein
LLYLNDAHINGSLLSSYVSTLLLYDQGDVQILLPLVLSVFSLLKGDGDYEDGQHKWLNNN